MRAQWKEGAPEAVKQQDLGGYPYHPLVYHLDLSILAYQLYADTLVWPFDPYYEELADEEEEREKQISQVRNWAAAQGYFQSQEPASLSHYRGPGLLGGFPDNPRHDPIVFRYDRINPWYPTVTNPSGIWIEHLTPAQVTRNIGKVYVCMRKNGGSVDDVILLPLAIRGGTGNGTGRDVLLAFEGDTGDKGEPNQPSSQSLLGYVLLRNLPLGEGYDVHIAFRGSRSGSAERAALQAIKTTDATGNPDWITDLGFRHLQPSDGGGHVSTIGKVSRGFAKSTELTCARIFRCLREVDAIKSGKPPRNITVTGHSLGGALAQHFVSAVLLGDSYGPSGTGNAMPLPLHDWPWKSVKLVTYGAPRAGDSLWAGRLSRECLDSVPFEANIDPFDRNALPVAHPSIIPRFSDASRPAAFRVLFSMDPITTKGLVGGNHVGRTVYVNEPELFDGFMLWEKDTHEPLRAREEMLGILDDPRIPPVAWRYLDMADLNSGREESAKGTPGEYRKIHEAIEQYYRKRGLPHDHVMNEREFRLFLTILRER